MCGDGPVIGIFGKLDGSFNDIFENHYVFMINLDVWVGVYLEHIMPPLYDI